MIKLENPKISMLVNFDGTTIELFDSKSAKTFARVKLTNDQLASMLSRLHRTECQIEVGNLELIDKQMEHQKFEFEINEQMRTSKGALHQHCLKALINRNMSDWLPENTYGSQDSFFSKEGKYFARTVIRRWS
jgi:hypothetical protein